MTRRYDHSGFTLIELLVVIAIIGVLSSTVLASLNSARTRARDARKQEDFRQISTALQLYSTTYNRMPPITQNGSGSCETSNSAAWNDFAQTFVNEGLLPARPKSPGGSPYCYYDYGAGNSIGVLIVTDLEAAPNTTSGIPPSCRPWSPGANWCSQSNTKEYCICNPY